MTPVGNWADRGNPAEGEEKDEALEAPLPQMAWEMVLANLSELRRSRLDPYDAALVQEAMAWARAHARYLYGEQEDAA